MRPPQPPTALVLSGGGMRGAYEVGVVAGLVEVLDGEPDQAAPFNIFAGTSVGAINASYFAANADSHDHRVERLVDTWQSLRLDDHARVRPLGLAPLPEAFKRWAKPKLLGKSLLDTRAVEVLVRRTVDWDRMHANVDAGIVRAVMVAALHVVSGRTTVFTEGAPGVRIENTRDERRVSAFERITADHVLASAAIPLLFPTRKLGEHYYCDGGLRFNTPIAPAIRAGAERLVVVSVRHQRSQRELAAVEAADHEQMQDLSPVFLVGKLLNALLLDPVQYDLQVLDRLNQMMEILEETLSPEDLERVHRVWVRHRGTAYRRIKTLTFTPSRDLGRLAAEYIRKSLKLKDLKPIARYLLERASREGPEAEADWASYMLFDGGFAHELIEVGKADTRARADEIREFFG
ncbi:MAG TPA: patatin-like phospholipase family protein [Polyangiaceae bacterium]|nr:patatin-like phospholipase family protein [Polyangiaceae bacterium]